MFEDLTIFEEEGKSWILILAIIWDRFTIQVPNLINPCNWIDAVIIDFVSLCFLIINLTQNCWDFIIDLFDYNYWGSLFKIYIF